MTALVATDLHSKDDPETDERLAFIHGLIRERSLATSDKSRIVSKSGMDRSWLMDLRPVLLNGRALSHIVSIFWERFAHRMPFQVGGLVIAAVPLVAAIVLEGERRGFSINAFFVRKERKPHGLGRIVEGDITDDPIVVIDDLTNSSSSLEAVRVAAADSNRKVVRAFVIIDYQSLRSFDWRQKHDIEVESLFTLKHFSLPAAPPRTYRSTHRFEPLWSVSSAGANNFLIAPSSSPAYDGKTLYFGTDGAQLRAIDAQSGSEVWNFQATTKNNKGIKSSPALHDGKVLFGAYDGTVYCLDTVTGKEVWSAHEAEWVGSSPAVAPRQGLLIIGLEHAHPSSKGSIAAFQLSTGAKVWEHFVSDFVHGSPVLSEDESRVFIGTNADNLLCLDTASGAVVWEYWTKGDIKGAPAVSDSLGVVVVGSFDRCIHVVDSTTGRPISVVKTGDRLFTTPLIVGDVAYVGSPDKHVYVIDLIDGSVLNTIDVAGRVYAKPALLGGIVYVGTTGGKLVGIDPVSSTCRQVLQLPDHVLSAPLLVEDDTVLVVPVLGSRLIAFSAKGFSGGLATQAQPRRTAPRTKAPPLSSIVIETAQAEGLYFRMAEPVGRPVVRPYSSMPSRRLLGAAVMIMAHAPGFKDLTHSDLKARVMPALVASQARVFLYGLQPIGLVTWARLNEEAERLLKEQGQLPSGSDWTSGNRIWIIDVVAPFGGTRAMLTKVCRETLRGQTVNMLQPRASGGFEAITLSS